MTQNRESRTPDQTMRELVARVLELEAERDRLLGHFQQLQEQLMRYRNFGDYPECSAPWFISRVGWHIDQALALSPQEKP